MCEQLKSISNTKKGNNEECTKLEKYHNFFHLFVYYGKFGKMVDEILDENFLLWKIW